MRICVYWILLTLWVPFVFAADLKLKDGDVVALVGNTFIERDAQHSYIETALTLAHPGKKIIFRNYGWSGDTVKGESRGYFKADGYGDLLKRVTEHKPSVIVLAYGANAAWNGAAGLPKFKAEFEKLIGDLQKTSKARFILVSPIKQEKLAAPYPDPTAHNKDLELYSNAVKEIAASKKFPFIDLFTKFDYSGEPLTSNSIHLNPRGYQKVAKIIGTEFGLKASGSSMDVDIKAKSVKIAGASVSEIKATSSSIEFKVSGKSFTFPGFSNGSDKISIKGLSSGDYTLLINGQKIADTSAEKWQKGVLYSGFQGETLRKAIVAKNELFFHAWRPQNTTYLFFFRKHEQGRNAKDIPAIYKHLQDREKKLVELQKPVSLHYKLIPSSKKLPEKPSVVKINNKYIPPAAEGIKKFNVPKDLEISIFAAEPMVVNPTNMNWDSQGRLWVCSAPTYPQIPAGELANDRILVLEDTDKDGKADKSTVFVDGLLIPTAVIPGNGGVYVANSTELVHFQDTNGDLKADKKTVILSGFGTEDTHHILHTPRWGQDGLLYISQSIYIHSHIETPFGVKRLMAGGIWQFDPRNGKLDILNYGLVNSWGHQMDKWGQSFATDGAGGHGINFIFPGHAGVTAYGTKHIIKGMNPGQPKHCGLEFITGTHFPEKYRGLILANDFRGHRTNVFKLTDSGSGYISKQQEDFLSTGSKGTDRMGKGGGFRPVDVKMGPDGAVYFADWSNIIIQHGEVDFRDARRDKQHGRIWRVTAKGRDLIKQPKIAGASIAQLLKNIKSTERWTVDMSKREIIERGAEKVLPELNKWTASLSASEDYYRLQSLWLQQGMGIVNEALLKKLLNTKEPRIRAAAVRVLRHFHDQVADVDSLLKVAVLDVHPRVRLEAVNALRVRKSMMAAEIAVLALDKETDAVIDYALTLTLRELEDYWAGKSSFNGNIKHVTYAIKATGNTATLSSLVNAYKAGKIPADARLNVLKIIANLGSHKEAGLLFKLALGKALEAKAKVAVLTELNNSAKTRRVKPATDLSGLSKLVESENGKVRNAAVKLAGTLGVKQALNSIQKLAAAGNDIDRGIAIKALTSFRDSKTLVALVKSKDKANIKLMALSGLIRINVKEASQLAPALLSSIPEGVSTVGLFNAFIQQKDGAKALSASLAGKKIPAYVASTGVRQCNTSGQSLPQLIKILSTAGDLKPMKQVLNAKEMAELVKAVNEKGDPHIGEAIYRIKALACLNCHAIGGAGPEIGPDLISIGASAPIDYIIESILQPTKKIKEGYHMTMVQTKDGKMLSGAEVSAGAKEIVLRDPSGKKTRILTKNIKKKTVVPMSMMPPGLTAQLGKEDFIHLVSFLSKLGKSGDFNMSKAVYLRSVKYTDMTSEIQKNFNKGSRGLFKKLTSLKWKTGYAKVDGFLPVNNGSIFKQKPQVLRVDIDVKKAGVIGLQLSQQLGISAKFSNGRPIKMKNGLLEIDVRKGRQMIFLYVNKQFPDEGLRVEMIELKASSSSAVFSK